MGYRKIFGEVGNALLSKNGFVQVKDYFYLYLPKEQLVKHISWRMIFDSREFELYFDIDSFVGQPNLVHEWGLAINQHNLNMSQYLSFKHEVSDWDKKYLEEGFRQDLTTALETFMRSDIYTEFMNVLSIQDLLNFRSHYCARRRLDFFENLQAENYDGAKEIARRYLEMEQKNLDYYGGYNEEHRRLCKEAGIRSRVVDTYHQVCFWENMLKCLEARETIKLQGIVRNRVNKGRKTCEEYFRRWYLQ